MNSPARTVDRDHEVRAAAQKRIFTGTGFARDEIAIAAAQILEQARILDATMKTLNEKFDEQKMVDIKLACDSAALTAARIEKAAAQCRSMSAHLGSTFQIHINRRSRV